jgi:hypothetical protein
MRPSLTRSVSLKRYWAKQRELYFKIALENTPETVQVVTILPKRRKKGEPLGYSRFSWGLIRSPVPNTIHNLWTYLHECYHMQPLCPTHLESEEVDERAADDFAISKISSAGIRIPVWMFFQYNARHNAWPDFDSLLTLDSDVAKYTLK